MTRRASVGSRVAREKASDYNTLGLQMWRSKFFPVWGAEIRVS